MAKKPPVSNQRRSLIILITAAVAFVLVGILVSQFRQSASSGTPAEGTIQINGTVLCLPHKDTSGPQTMECAYGIKDDQGRYFGLGDSSPNYENISGIPMNERVRVSGTFKEGASEIYPTIGTITVTEITEL